MAGTRKSRPNSLDNDTFEELLTRYLYADSPSEKEKIAQEIAVLEPWVTRELEKRATPLQCLYYLEGYREGMKRTPRIRAKVMAEIGMSSSGLSGIWAYFNGLLISKNLSWKKVLSLVGLSSSLADRFLKGQEHISAVEPAKVAALAKIIGADPHVVLALARKALSETPPGLAVSWRLSRVAMTVDPSARKKKLEPEAEDYITYLQDALGLAQESD